jgi:hypothetical protein
MVGYLVPKAKPSNSVTLSAFVQTPMPPAALIFTSAQPSLSFSSVFAAQAKVASPGCFKTCGLVGAELSATTSHFAWFLAGDSGLPTLGQIGAHVEGHIRFSHGRDWGNQQ